MDLTPIRIDSLPLDGDLTDSGSVGPELAYTARAYCATPRALIWRYPSSEWPLLLLTLPIATRLSLLTNPIFARLVREWGLSIRFLGIDRAGLVYDFRALLDAKALQRLVDALGRWLAVADDAAGEELSVVGLTGKRGASNAALDTIFDMLASDMLTVLEQRRDDWTVHLARDGALVPDDSAPAVAGPSLTHLSADPTALFDRRARYPEFIAQLHQALRRSVIGVEFYSRVLRSIDRRERDVESRIISIMESALDPITLTKLARTRLSGHLGCYNWLQHDHRARAHRAATLGKLPLFAQFFCDRLVAASTPSAREQLADRLMAQGLQGPAAEAALRDAGRAIDTGQDRWTIVALARYFHVSENLIRSLWRNCPAALGTPPTWHLRQILRALDQRPERSWPQDDTGWAVLRAQSIPASLASG